MKILLHGVILLGWLIPSNLIADEKRYEFSEPHMGTVFRFLLYAQNAEQAEKVAKAGFHRVRQLNLIFSDYDPKSEIMQLTKHFDRQNDEGQAVSFELFAVLQYSKQLTEKSAGAFDVTLGPLTQLWRNSRKTQRLPKPEEVADAINRSGAEKIQLLDANQRTIRLLKPGMRLDFGGIAKGYAADEVLKIFRSYGIENALVAAGGDITCIGKETGKMGWEVEILPLPGTTTKRTLLLKNQAVSTSGDFENYALIQGERYSHIVDRKTGLGLTGERMVTVVAPTGMQADSLTKVASVKEPKEALELFQSIPGVEAYIVRRLPGKMVETFQSEQFEKCLLLKPIK